MARDFLTLRFDEPFFDLVFRRLGWSKVPRIQGHKPGGRTVDYIGDGCALELKNLETDSYGNSAEAGEKRRLRLLKFQTEQFFKGNLVVDWVNAVARAPWERSQEFNRELWEHHLGSALRNAMTEADEQIANTRQLPSRCGLRGAVLIVNEASPLIDTLSLAQLLASYLSEKDHADPSLRRLRNTDVAYGMCSQLERISGPDFALDAHKLVCAGPQPPSEADFDLQTKLCAAITAEVEAKVGPLSSSSTANVSSSQRPTRRQVIKLPKSPMTITVDDAAVPLEPGFTGIIKRSWEKARRHSEEEKGHETKKCHYFPRFLIKRWEDADGKIQVEDVATGLTGPKTAAEVGVRTDLYSVLLPSGTLERRFLERFFQIIEEAADKILGMPLYPPATADGVPSSLVPGARQVLSLLVGIQILRLPSVLDALAEEWKSDWQADWGYAPDGLPHRGNLLYRLLGGSAPFEGYGAWFAGVVQTIHDKRWSLLARSPGGPRIQTGDIPVRIVIRTPVTKPPLEPKDWIIQMPLGPDLLLALDEDRSPETPLEEGLFAIGASEPPLTWAAPGLRERIH